MNVLAQQAKSYLHDTGLYRLQVPPHVQVTHEDFENWVRSREDDLKSFGERLSKEQAGDTLTHKAKDLLQNYQAFYLLFRSMDLDTQAVQRNYEIWSQTLVDALKGAEGKDKQLEIKDKQLEMKYSRISRDLFYYPDERYRNEVFKLAEKIWHEQATRGAPVSERPNTDQPSISLPFRIDELKGLVIGIPYTSDRYVYLEESFARDMVENWSLPNLSATSHAIEVLHILSRRLGNDFDITPAVLDFVEQHAVPGGYRASLKGNSEPDLYATTSAIAVHKARNDLICNDVLREDRALKSLGSRRVNEILEATTKQLDALLEPSATASSSLRRITDLHQALRIVRHIASRSDSDLPQEIINRRSKIANFLVECYIGKTELQEDKAANSVLPAFTLARKSRVYCLTAYFFAAKISRYCELAESEIDDRLESAKGFVRSCFDGLKGFGCIPGQEADLIHTHFGISLILNGDVPMDRMDYKDKVEAFVGRCRKDGGYALLPDWKPSAYGTRIAIQILEALGLPIPETTQIQRFIEDLKDPGTGGYRGYHLERRLGAA